MKKIKHIGVYGLIIKNNKMLLIKKNGGPYDGKYDLPGGTIEFEESIEEALIRELKEEVGIDIIEYNLYDVISTNIEWYYKDELQEIKHIAILYIINDFKNEIKEYVEITYINDDSKGAYFYDLNNIKKEELSKIVEIALKKLNYLK